MKWTPIIMTLVSLFTGICLGLILTVGCKKTNPNQAQAESNLIVTWEFKCIHTYPQPGKEIKWKDRIAKANELGKQGWEPVFVASGQAGDLCLKRRHIK